VVWTGLIWLRIGISGSSCEHGNERSVSMKCWESVERWSDWRLHKEDSSTWSYLAIYEIGR
jgi:hypothetical protein